MRLPVGGNRGGKPQLQMTSMIDVVFLLLIFFVCTASFQEPEVRLPTHLLAQGTAPTDTPAPPDPFEPVRVQVAREGETVVWTLAGRTIRGRGEIRAALAALAQAAPEVPVVVDPAGPTPIGDVIELYDFCRVAGFAKIQFAAKL